MERPLREPILTAESPLDEQVSALEARLGQTLFQKRIHREAGRAAHLLHQGEGFFRLESYVPLDRIVGFLLAVSGLGRVVRRGFLDVRVVTQEWELESLPAAFDGFRLLQLTDLHADLDPALTPEIIRAIQATPHDAAVITGDFRNKTEGDCERCISETAKIVQHLATPRWGILGNHDFLEMVPRLEAMGLPCLLNEAASIEREGARLWIGGIDDPHFYHTDDLARVRDLIPRGECSILLAHSPEVYEEAARLGFDLQLSGHTHAGQLCLPGGHWVLVPCKVARRFVKGRWTHGPLQGYTSPGTGSCGVAARWNCPPEVTLHVLRTASTC